MRKILITGALGQIGTELANALRERHGTDQVVASDIRMPHPGHPGMEGPFEFLDATNARQIHEVVRKHNIGTIYHLAALLSAVAEQKPQVAWDINMGGLYRILEVARQSHCAVFMPSSIGAFGPSTPRNNTPQDTIQRPTTIYGITKVAGELLCDYYHSRFGVDTRGLRFPGLISYEAPPGGGTTDYAVEIFYEAIRNQRYTCFLREDTRLDMMYMPDAIAAIIALMEAEPKRLKHRNAFNVSAMNFTPQQLAECIRQHVPAFSISYHIDPVRQSIADSWPASLDDKAAREEWGWKPAYDMQAMTKDMLEKLDQKLKNSKGLT